MNTQNSNFSPYIISITNVNDSKGSLTSVSDADIPYEIKRVFAITVTSPNLERGGHAHKVCWQTIAPLQGRILMFVSSNRENSEFLIDKGEALVVPPENWILLKFEEVGDSAMVFASEYYDELDYIFEKPILNEFN
jgi:hypothetical protein